MMARMESSRRNSRNCLTTVRGSRMTPSTSITPILSPKPANSPPWLPRIAKPTRAKTESRRTKNAVAPTNIQSHSRDFFSSDIGEIECSTSSSRRDHAQRLGHDAHLRRRLADELTVGVDIHSLGSFDAQLLSLEIFHLRQAEMPARPHQ